MMQKAFLGEAALCNLRNELQSLGIKRLFLVRGRSSYAACGAEKALTPVFSDLAISVVEFKDFSVNPKMEEALVGAERCLSSSADCILAVGGGSAIDMAKIIRHLVAEKGESPVLMAMPTTAGTGAETTHFAVVYVDGKKQSLEADDVLPDYAFVYPPFTYANNAYLTACTGFDALAQACEAFWNRYATEESTEYALRAISLLFCQLPECLSAPTGKLRDDIALGAYWAGRAINITKTTAPHAFSYAFTSKCGYPHGHAVAITFPFFAELNINSHPRRSDFFRALGLEESSSLQAFFLDYTRRLGLQFNGSGSFGLDMLLSEVNLQRLKNNPVEVDGETICRLHAFLNNQ